MVSQPRRLLYSQRRVGARDDKSEIVEPVHELQRDGSRSVVRRIEIEHNDTRGPRDDQMVDVVWALGWFDAARLQIAAKQLPRHQFNDILVPENQRHVYSC